MVNQERLINTFLKLLEVDSPSKQEKELRNFLEVELKNRGLTTSIDKAGDKLGGNTGNLIAKLKGVTTEKTLLFSAHMDTVLSTKGLKVIIEDGIIKTDGKTILGADDKAGIAILLEALTVITEAQISHGDLEIVFTISEELGLLGSRYLDHTQLKARVGYVLDSGEDVGVVISQAPSEEDFTLQFIGKEAHSGVNPEDGINALQMAGDFLSWFPYGRIDEETTGNIGTIKGGEATNVVPAKVELVGEIRSRNDAKVDSWISKIEVQSQTIAKKYGGKAVFKSERMYSSFNLNQEDIPVKLALKALDKIGLVGTLKSRGGGSDANNFNKFGIPSVNLAIGMTKSHTNEEYIKIENLCKGAELVLALITEAGKQGS